MFFEMFIEFLTNIKAIILNVYSIEIVIIAMLLINW